MAVGACGLSVWLSACERSTLGTPWGFVRHHKPRQGERLTLSRINGCVPCRLIFERKKAGYLSASALVFGLFE
ncbi:MAG: hypothetical protein RR338_01145 [Clostridia bacterium]